MKKAFYLLLLVVAACSKKNDGSDEVKPKEKYSNVTMVAYKMGVTDWENYSKTQYIYEADNDTSHVVLNQVWENGAWVNGNRAIVKHSEILSQLWVDGQWRNHVKNEQIYDQKDSLVESVTYLLNESDQWIPSSKVKFFYNENFNRFRSENYTWDGDWKLGSLTIYEYNEQHKLLSATTTLSNLPYVTVQAYTYTTDGYTQLTSTTTSGVTLSTLIDVVLFPDGRASSAIQTDGGVVTFKYIWTWTK